MIHHTMIVAFDEPIPSDELDAYLQGLEKLTASTGTFHSFAARTHLRAPSDDHAPVAVASAVVQFALADLDALDAAFALPGIGEFIAGWQARRPYKAIWVNHEPLAQAES
ncbi:hypothetical protein OG599_02850 [Streptomyces sp. NBC_01335]|uniref:hypothetical protein n=1 Tax=Streptomyces sp. NBC_01335 TaxID=2903828 RepID=UPI002E0FBB45|nr:hypothetical protein OG599_02850 [Streptomyces sp. NBC_01335]